MTSITEQSSLYDQLENRSVEELTGYINQEDEKVAAAIKAVLPDINKLITAIVDKLKAGGRMFYLGAGSGGRLSVLDVIELPTTYGLPKGTYNSILAGGIDRLADALEEKEDDLNEGWDALLKAGINPGDIVVGISASGTTPFVLEALKKCRAANVTTGCIVSNPATPIAEQADYPVVVITGPEFITGSTRMKCGTAQKMLFDMISTTVMIRLGRVEGNSMVNVKLINDKILDRAVKILMQKAGIEDYAEAKSILLAHGSVKAAMDKLNSYGRATKKNN
ncbi:N-acetylmuramic acid 6-phosphate etherase [Pedobacter africanus]|uniref:N-acetylmuramic acid 6-phosphate etherase n=1 Tax=Pedobacter africanus TaxID=151894 RepID=A0ACC6KXP7_9SPHI|nr:N-acetylmuramic acid 6-phosphate etherase [Pedobacter africanus]MDR6783936.1 N-acetylmuramic acid 6-phosphate etherase [Pedobacter africanus]